MTKKVARDLEKSVRLDPPAPPAVRPAGDEPDGDDELRLSDDEEGGVRIGDIYIPPSVKPHCSTESKGPRLVITHIVNKNFKSYAGEVTLGPFYHQFHAVIGPNGSGKSNVIDSMLFVFGYRAKKIRSQKLSSMLHSSTKYPSVTECSVAVHFQAIVDAPDGSAIPQPGTQFFIRRTAYADNSSHYVIDDKRATFKEVARLLKSYEVDLDHHRFLILQGEVESIAMMKPKALTPNECGLLEYFEDIIGTSRYKRPLEQISARVESLTEERTEKHNRCKLAEREMKDLKQPKQEAVEYLEAENTLTRNINLHVQKYLSEQAAALVELGAERQEHADRLQQHDDEQAALVAEREAKEATIREENERYRALVKKKEEYERMLKNSLNKYAEIQSGMAATNKRRKEMKAQLAAERTALETWLAMPEKHAVEVAECEKKIAALEAKRSEADAQLQENLTGLEAETAPVLAEKARLETELIGLQETVNECQAAVKLAESELRLCTEAETMEKRKYETFRRAFEDATQAVEEKSARVGVLEQTIEAKRTELGQKQAEQQANEVKERDLVQRIRKQRADLEEITRNAQQTQSNNKVLNALMKQKAEGRIPGVLGRLGDLGGIDAKYDVAISTCCGRLDNIVVDTVNTAQECIEYLKRSDVGRATFIALEKVAHLANKMHRIQTPENAPRLFDLIRVEDERVSAAFYFALGDTLVANNLEHGTRIAYGAQRYRVVSLRGDVIETSGTMSGGGTSQMRGRMGQQVKQKSSATAARNSLGAPGAANVDDLRQRTLELQNEINYLQEQQGHLERNIAELQQQLRQADAELKRLRLDVAGLQQHLPRQQQQMQQQHAIMENTTSDAGRTIELQSKVAGAQASHDEAKANSERIVVQVQAAKQRIKAITGERVGQLEKRIADMDKQLAALRKNVTKLTVEMSTSERNARKAEATIQSLTEDVQQAEDQLRHDNEERAQVDKDSVAMTASIEKVTAELTAANSDSSETKREITALAKREADGQLVRVELAQQLQTAAKKVQEVQDSLPHWRRKLQPLRLNVIPADCMGSAEQVERQAQDERDGVLTLKTYSDEELAEFKLEDLQYKISCLEEKLKQQKPNLSVIEEFYRKRVVYLERVTVLEGITKKRNDMLKVYDDVRKKRYHEFLGGFMIISKRLREMYQMITQGGDAELELMDSMDPFSEGVSFSVRPPKKSWKNISNLSGGEKTLSSLALVFALHYYKPSPLYFMDEIDAALDFKNVSIVANYIKARTRNAQFIIISLRTNMFELSDYLTGIYKVRDCTNSVTLRNDQSRDDYAQPTASGLVTSTQATAPLTSQPIESDPRIEEISIIEASQPMTQQEQQQRELLQRVRRDVAEDELDRYGVNGDSGRRSGGDGDDEVAAASTSRAADDTVTSTTTASDEMVVDETVIEATLPECDVSEQMDVSTSSAV